MPRRFSMLEGYPGWLERTVICWFLLLLISNSEEITLTVQQWTSLFWECDRELASSGVSKFRDWMRCRLQTCVVLCEALMFEWCPMLFPQLLCRWPCWRDVLSGLGGLLSLRNPTVVNCQTYTEQRIAMSFLLSQSIRSAIIVHLLVLIIFF